MHPMVAVLATTKQANKDRNPVGTAEVTQLEMEINARRQLED